MLAKLGLCFKRCLLRVLGAYKSAKDVMVAETQFAADRQWRVNTEGDTAVYVFNLVDSAFVLTPCCSMRVNSFTNCCTMQRASAE